MLLFVLVVCLSLVYLVLQVGFVRPYLWPGGHGATLEGESSFAGSVDRTMLLARPPAVGDHELTIVKAVLPGGPAAKIWLDPFTMMVQWDSMARPDGPPAAVPITAETTGTMPSNSTERSKPSCPAPGNVAWPRFSIDSTLPPTPSMRFTRGMR